MPANDERINELLSLEKSGDLKTTEIDAIARLRSAGKFPKPEGQSALQKTMGWSPVGWAQAAVDSVQLGGAGAGRGVGFLADVASRGIDKITPDFIRQAQKKVLGFDQRQIVKNYYESSKAIQKEAAKPFLSGVPGINKVLPTQPVGPQHVIRPVGAFVTEILGGGGVFKLARAAEQGYKGYKAGKSLLGATQGAITKAREYINQGRTGLNLIKPKTFSTRIAEEGTEGAFRKGAGFAKGDEVVSYNLSRTAGGRIKPIASDRAIAKSAAETERLANAARANPDRRKVPFSAEKFLKNMSKRRMELPVGSLGREEVLKEGSKKIMKSMRRKDILRSMIQGEIAANVAFDPMLGGISNVINPNWITSVQPGDSETVARLKLAAEGAVLAPALEALLPLARGASRAISSPFRKSGIEKGKPPIIDRPLKDRIDEAQSEAAAAPAPEARQASAAGADGTGQAAPDVSPQRTDNASRNAAEDGAPVEIQPDGTARQAPETTTFGQPTLESVLAKNVGELDATDIEFLQKQVAGKEPSASYLDTEKLALARMKQKIVVQLERPKGQKYNPDNAHQQNVNIGGITYRGVPGFGIDKSQFPEKALKTLERQEVENRLRSFESFDRAKRLKFGVDKWKREVADLKQRIDKLKREEEFLYRDDTPESAYSPSDRAARRLADEEHFNKTRQADVADENRQIEAGNVTREADEADQVYRETKELSESIPRLPNQQISPSALRGYQKEQRVKVLNKTLALEGVQGQARSGQVSVYPSKELAEGALARIRASSPDTPLIVTKARGVFAEGGYYVVEEKSWRDDINRQVRAITKDLLKFSWTKDIDYNRLNNLLQEDVDRLREMLRFAESTDATKTARNIDQARNTEVQNLLNLVVDPARTTYVASRGGGKGGLVSTQTKATPIKVPGNDLPTNPDIVNLNGSTKYPESISNIPFLKEWRSLEEREIVDYHARWRTTPEDVAKAHLRAQTINGKPCLPSQFLSITKHITNG